MSVEFAMIVDIEEEKEAGGNGKLVFISVF
jgi:hypothetical protein